MPLLLLAGCGGGTESDPAAHLRTLDSLRAELYAGAPDLHDPIAFCFDETARPFVLDRTPEGTTRVRICDDRDGDGHADHFVDYAEDVGAASGILKAHAGIVIASAPDLLLLRDIDGDDVADERRVLFTGFGRFDGDAGPSQLVWGPNNRLYGVVGPAGFDGVDADGRPQRFAQGIWSCDPDGGGLEFVAALPGTASGLGWSPDLELWGATAEDARSHLVGVPRPVLSLLGVDAARAELPATSAPSPNGPAARGHSFIESVVMPEELHDEAMQCLPSAGRVVRLRVQSEGSGFRTVENGDLLSADGGAFTPVQATVGHDGEIWVADAIGSIWRVVAIGRDPIDCAGQGESALIPSGFAMRTIAQPLASAPFVKLSLGALRVTEESARALLDSGRLQDADLVLRRHAFVAAARMPVSDALGAALAPMLLDPAVVDDPWLPLALRAAAARHAVGFLSAATPLLADSPSAPAHEQAAAIARAFGAFGPPTEVSRYRAFLDNGGASTPMLLEAFTAGLALRDSTGDR